MFTPLKKTALHELLNKPILFDANIFMVGISERTSDAQLSLAEKIGRFAMKICLFILPLMLLVTVIAGVLAYYQMIDVPGVSAIMDHFSIHYHSADVEKDIPETDTEGFTYYESSEENLVKDDETGVMFVNNELLVTLVSEEYKSELEEYVSTIGGNIAGELPEAAEYQILLPATYSYAQLQEIIEDMKTFEWFSYSGVREITGKNVSEHINRHKA